VLVVHDLESWWERKHDGNRVIEQLFRCVEQYADRCVIIININIHSYRFINELMPLSDHALAVVDCAPMNARQLKEVVLRRHRSSGHRMQLGRRTGDQLTEWSLARFFTGLFEYARGSVGVALQGWLGHINAVHGEVVSLEVARYEPTELTDDLRPEWIAILVQLILHRQCTRERLLRITGVEEGQLHHHVSTLVRMGLLVEDNSGSVQLNRYIQHLVVSDLSDRGFLP
jgi:hypothetical protein